MFYKILFLLTVMNFILDVKKYIHEYRVWLIAKNKVQCDDVPIGLYLKIGISVWFYIMVLTLIFRPHLLWWYWS